MRFGALAGVAVVASATASCLVDIPDVVGADAGDAAQTNDATDFDAPDLDAPPTCTDLDASACLPNVPDGWAPVIVSADGGCGASWSAKTLKMNPRLDDAGCSCTCSAFGSYSCTSAAVSLAATTGLGCGTTSNMSEGICKSVTTQDFGFAANPKPYGTPSCSTSIQTATVDSDPLPTCAPIDCSLDFCAAPGRKCIETSGTTSCPAGYSTSFSAGGSASGTCPSCACVVDTPANCNVALTLYSGTFCNQAVASVLGAGICSSYGGYDGGPTSLKWVGSGGGPATCTASQSGQGSATLGGLRTICCTN